MPFPIRRCFPRTLFLAALTLFESVSGPFSKTAHETNGRGGPLAILPSGHKVWLEIARTPNEQARGYMFRDRVGPKEGMLFLFPESDFHSFWMKNCRTALDILWLDEDFRVVHLESEVPPCRHDPCPSYSPMRKAHYTLEVRSGLARRTGARIGEIIRFENVPWTTPAGP